MASIVKRKTGFMYQIYLGKDTNGKPLFESKAGFKTKTEAKEAAQKREDELKNLDHVELKDISFGEFAKRWLKLKEDNIRENTYQTYVERIKNHMIPYFNRTKLSDLKVMHIKEWHDKLKQKINRTTIQDVHKLMKRMIKDAVLWEIIPKNPFELIKTPNSETKKLEVWEKDEVSYFLQSIKSDPMYMAIYLALATGMRQSEILGLRWECVNFENRTISITATLQRATRKLVEDTKSKTSARSIACSSDIIGELKRYRKEQKQNQLIAGSAWQANDLVITTGFGTPVIARNLNRSFDRLKKKYNMKSITFHELRHTHATLLLKANIHPKIVSERLGHSTIKVTLDRYSHVIPNMQKEAADLIDQLLQSN